MLLNIRIVKRQENSYLASVEYIDDGGFYQVWLLHHIGVHSAKDAFQDALDFCKEIGLEVE